MVVLTKEQAKEIIDIFGPCTALYECGSTSDLIADASRMPTLFDLLRCLVSVESVTGERMCDGASYSEEEGAHARMVASANAMEKRLKLKLFNRFGFDYDVFCGYSTTPISES